MRLVKNCLAAALSILVVVLGHAPTDAQTQAIAIYQAASKEIRETVPVICQTVPTEQTNNQITLSGQANAQLDGLIQKIVNLGISGAAQYQSGSSKGVLQNQLAGAIADRNMCGIKATEILNDMLK